MMNIRRGMTALGMVALAGALTAVLAAQQPQPGAATQAPGQAGQTQKASIAEGELVSVNLDTKTLTVRGADKKDMQFIYTARTEVSGAKEGAVGLASMKGSQVTVHYTREGTSNTASKIMVRAKER